MRPYRDSRWTKIALVLFFVLIVVYAYFELRGLIYGPKLEIASDVSTTHEQYVLIAGNAQRIVSLSMNGKEITVTETGDFSEPYLLAKGLNHIVFDAKDTYGHTTSQSVEIMYVPTQEEVSLVDLPTATTPTESTSSPPRTTSTSKTLQH